MKLLVLVLLFVSFSYSECIKESVIDKIWSDAQHKKAELVIKYKEEVFNRFIETWVKDNKKDIEKYVDSLVSVKYEPRNNYVDSSGFYPYFHGYNSGVPGLILN